MSRRFPPRALPKPRPPVDTMSREHRRNKADARDLTDTPSTVRYSWENPCI
jgi:hypothetical protein